jgi:hypothetical protein
MVVSMTYLFYAITQCCESETGTSGTEIFCLNGTETGTEAGTGIKTFQSRNRNPANHSDSTALLVSKFLGFSVSYVFEKKIPRAPESDAFVYYLV